MSRSWCDADRRRRPAASAHVARGDHSDLGGVWQEQLGTGLSNNPFTLTYSANGQPVAVRNGSVGIAGSGTVTYLHSDHLGSASVVSNAAGRSRRICGWRPAIDPARFAQLRPPLDVLRSTFCAPGFWLRVSVTAASSPSHPFIPAPHSHRSSPRRPSNQPEPGREPARQRHAAPALRPQRSDECDVIAAQ